MATLEVCAAVHKSAAESGCAVSLCQQVSLPAQAETLTGNQ
jgi:hypothetical protein